MSKSVMIMKKLRHDPFAPLGPVNKAVMFDDSHQLSVILFKGVKPLLYLHHKTYNQMTHDSNNMVVSKHFFGKLEIFYFKKNRPRNQSNSTCQLPETCSGANQSHLFIHQQSWLFGHNPWILNYLGLNLITIITPIRVDMKITSSEKNEVTARNML